MTADQDTEDRRGFLVSVLMWAGVALGYGLGAVHFLSFLVPLGDKVPMRELFVGTVRQFKIGESTTIKTPAGDSYVLARTRDGFRVLSDVCPHLGCRVHWVATENHFLCPCHMGIFDAEGKAIAGPPAEAGQNLTQLETRVIPETPDGKVFVMIKES
jgi:cytochrome b6-f complex iron-sulfur subunit